MKRFMNKKVAAIGLAAGLALGAAGAAFAYFTTTASGPGSATVGTNTALDIVQTGSISGLTPGGPTVPVTYTIDNPTGNGAQNLGVVTFTITGFSGNTNTPNTCTAADFTITPGGSVVGTIADGATYTSVVGTEPTIQMKETGANQNGCENAVLTLSLTAAAGS